MTSVPYVGLVAPAVHVSPPSRLRSNPLGPIAATRCRLAGSMASEFAKRAKTRRQLRATVGRLVDAFGAQAEEGLRVRGVGDKGGDGSRRGNLGPCVAEIGGAEEAAFGGAVRHGGAGVGVALGVDDDVHQIRHRR